MSRNEEVEAWYKIHASNIKKWANKKSKQDAEDILQDTALKLLTSPSKWEAITTRKATRWAMYDYYKGLPEFVEIEDSEVPESVTQALIAKKSVEVLSKIMNSWQPRKGSVIKQIFEMHFFQELRYDEIAKILKLDHHSVRQLGSQGRKIVVEKFKEIVDK